MSIFRTIEVHCPKCATPVEFEVVYSVAADRRPEAEPPAALRGHGGNRGGEPREERFDDDVVEHAA